MLKNSKIVLGVTGGIAVYKAVELVRRLVNLNATVRVIMTRNSREFVTPLTFQTISSNRVITGLFDLLEESKIGHIAVAEWADVFVIAPATANILGKISNGVADDFLSTSVMATKAPVLLAPAMNTNMFENHIVQRNINNLKSLGYHFVEPASGELACGTEGLGRLAEVDDIIEEIEAILSKKDLLGEKVLVTAGPTTEFIDPIRFITNRSTGKMGYAIARVAKRRGADVTLITGPGALPVPRNVKCSSVATALEMRAVVLDNFEDSTIVIKAAAVGDYELRDAHSQKMKRGKANLTLQLKETPDILSEIGKKKGERIHVGFAAETEDLIQNARSKLVNKNLDLIVANDVCMPGAGFECDTNIVKILDREGNVEELPLMSKEEVAEKILDRVIKIKIERSKNPSAVR
ncbi:MAG: bifunctional phosphopantothenoylcysteine decarboxylase/phosphopantothenate--cysteine ligase CoaBC [Pseudomonadota bacterium]